MKLKRTIRAGIRDQRGDTLIEIAISAVVVLTLLFGVMEFGRAMYVYHFVSYAAQAGTRYAIVRGNSWKTDCSSSTTGFSCKASTSDIQTYVQGIAPPGVTGSSVTVTPTWPGTTPNSSGAITCTAGVPSPGCVVQVAVSYQFTFIAPFMPGPGFTFNATSQQVIQK